MGTKTLIAVISCHESRRSGGTPGQKIQSSAETWMKNVRELRPDVDIKVFRGRPHRDYPRHPLYENVSLDCDDSYTGLVYKVKAIVQYALLRGYEHMFKVDDDTYVGRSVIEMLNDDPDAAYVGQRIGDGVRPKQGYTHRNGTVQIEMTEEPYIEGPINSSGGCYRLNRQSMEVIHTTEVRPDDVPGRINHAGVAEDKWVGFVLNRAGFKFTPANYSECQGIECPIAKARLLGMRSIMSKVDIQEAFILLGIAYLRNFNCTSAEKAALYQAEQTEGFWARIERDLAQESGNRA